MKTKKAMKKITHIGMAALVAMGMLGTSCNKAESPEIETPETQKENIVTLTTTVGFAVDGTKALTIDYTAKTLTKTFAVGDQIALIYRNTSSQSAKAVSKPLTAGDISAAGKSATFTFELTDPRKSGPVTYIYPAAMASENGTDWDKLNTQDGTLASIASNLDCAKGLGMWSGDALPKVTLTNGVAIIAYTLKDETGENDITSTITGMTISDGSHTYNITGKDADGHIYAAIWPTDNANIEYTATDGTKNYTKSVTGKTYETGQFYQVGLRMTEAAPAATQLSTISSDYTAQDGETLTGTLANNVKISIADGATVTLKDVTINGVSDPSYGWAGITCAGDATITLEGTNTVKGFQRDYPGIYVPEGKTLTIEGEGSLNASGNGYSTGIGGGYYMNCGDIVINGGNITATGGNYNAGIGGGEGGDCGAITINGGTVTATGGGNAAGIGGGYDANCGNITISGGNVTATGGYWAAGIGGGKRGYDSGSCGNITISGGTITATGGDNAAGIGGGTGRNNSNPSSCGTITITSGVTSVTATKGSSAPNSIGAGYWGTCGAVTIEDPSKVTQN
ncbi:MAG: hypothetical protein IJ687_02455 [Bacteroidales bacterium]|nr:hypothetical protein [Bacteroidales bacterium]